VRWGIIEVGEPDGKNRRDGGTLLRRAAGRQNRVNQKAPSAGSRGARRVIRRRRAADEPDPRAAFMPTDCFRLFKHALHEALRRVSRRTRHPPVTPWTLRAAATTGF